VLGRVSWEINPRKLTGFAGEDRDPLQYTDPDGMRFRICDTSGNCYDEYADEDFYKNFTGKHAKQEGVSFKGSKILKDGKEIGTWQRLSFDDLSPAGNAFLAGMSDRRQASNAFIATFAAGSVAVGATGGAVAYYSGATPGSGLTTLGLRSGHGAYRLALRGFTEADIGLTKTGHVLEQADGAKVFIKEIAPGKFNVLVEGKHGVVSALKNISQKSLERLSRNYGWK